MAGKKRLYTYIDFLKSDRFTEWRILRTEEAEEYWSLFIKEHPESKAELEKAIEKFDLVRLNERKEFYAEQDALYNRITASISKSQQRRKRLVLYLSSAAACAAILILSFFIFDRDIQLQDIPDNLLTEEISGSDGIKLISGDVMVDLNQNAQIDLTESGKAYVTYGKDSITDIEVSQNTLNKIIVPYGKRSTLTLSDGTKVWLNSGTELEFPSQFEGETRDISVKGEIFLDVAENKSKPFLVHTSELTVRVHGTQFNVSAYAEDINQSIVLVEGKVEVQTDKNTSLQLRPSEMAMLTPAGLNKSKVNTEEYTSWVNGWYMLNKTPMINVLKSIERYYNVSFEGIDNPVLSEKTCTGKLLLSNDIDSVMRAVTVLSDITYKRDGRTIYINH